MRLDVESGVVVLAKGIKDLHRKTNDRSQGFDKEFMAVRSKALVGMTTLGHYRLIPIRTYTRQEIEGPGFWV